MDSSSRLRHTRLKIRVHRSAVDFNCPSIIRFQDALQSLTKENNMLAIKKGKAEKRRYTVNILPCLISHDGPFTTSKRYWNPVDQLDGLSVAFFRGKKLYGKRLRLPERYRKVVLSKTDKTIPERIQAFAKNATQTESEHVVEDEENDAIVKILEEQSEFDDIMIWGHETLPDETTDPFVRGIQEWIDFSALLHSYDDDINDSESTSSVRC